MDFEALYVAPVLIPVAIWLIKKLITALLEKLEKYRQIPQSVLDIAETQQQILLLIGEQNELIHSLSDSTRLTAQAVELMRDDMRRNYKETSARVLKLSERIAVVESSHTLLSKQYNQQ